MSGLEGSRWNLARNKDRNEARYNLRQRISLACAEMKCNDEFKPIDDITPICANLSIAPKSEEETTEVQKFFNSVSKGSVSSFSLKVISSKYDVLSSLHDPDFMSSYKIKTLCTSRFGKEFADAVLLYKEKITHCSLIEYASLIGEYAVVSQLLSGGINPSYFVMDDSNIRNMKKKEVSKLAMQKLVADLIPSSLAAYIIRSLYVMKMWSVSGCHEKIAKNECRICLTTSSEPLLTFAASCNHKCCEVCMWEYVLKKINLWTEGNVVRCPTCEICLDESKCTKSLNEGGCNKNEAYNKNATPIERMDISLRLFKSLPKDVHELKKLPKKAKSKNPIHSTWHSALLPNIGSSQDVRSDKFARYIDRGAIHYCRACLQAGIDVNVTNEYNQTPLYIACWRNWPDIVKLLLEWGADPNIKANGEMSALNVARENSYIEIVQELALKCSNEDVCTTLKSRISNTETTNDESQVSLSLHRSVTTLISEDLDHAGAGSYFIDNIFPENILNVLDNLWSTLPMATGIDVKKKKSSKVPCSDRYYFCDSEAFFSNLLARQIESTMKKNGQSFKCVKVFPHMRFLNYRQSGSVLAPHVDLFKKDGKTGMRSTHTFILYLTDCENGGETALLKELPSGGPCAHQPKVIAKITPKRGRLLLFPHLTPHEGREVISVPKLLLRGEAICLQ